MTGGERILVADDEPGQRELLGGHLRHLGYQVAEAEDGGEAVARVREGGIDLVLLDQRMPRLAGADAIRALRDVDPEMDIVVVTAYGSIEDAVEALKVGATDYLAKPIDLDRLQIVVRKALERRTLLRENRELRQKVAGGPRLAGLVGSSSVLDNLLNTAARVAPTEVTVLITGESGTGKELVARALHAASKRSAGPFVGVHCAALAETLLESELFGHERGAFTGAIHSRPGRFEAARGGTLFLDEIGTISPAVQVKLLRVLQERRVERVGSNTPIDLDVRLVAATNLDLADAIRAGRFREDLYYRLAVVTLYVPRLRDRRGDIPALVSHFLARHARAGAHPVEGISREAMDVLLRYDYPGNVRELENIVQGAVVLSRTGLITTDDLPAAVRAHAEDERGGVAAADGFLPGRIAEMEKRLIEEALLACDGVQCRAAERLGISERTLRYKLDKHHIR